MTTPNTPTPRKCPSCHFDLSRYEDSLAVSIIGELEDKLQAATAELEKARAENNRLHDHLVIETERCLTWLERHDKLKSKLSTARAEIERLNNECIVRKTAIANLHDEITRLKKEQDGRAVTGGSKTNPRNDAGEAKDGSPCATVESSASEERDRQSPSVDYERGFWAGFAAAREMAAKVAESLKWDEEKVKQIFTCPDCAEKIADSIRSIEPGE